MPLLNSVLPSLFFFLVAPFPLKSSSYIRIAAPPLLYFFLVVTFHVVLIVPVLLFPTPLRALIISPKFKRAPHHS